MSLERSKSSRVFTIKLIGLVVVAFLPVFMLFIFSFIKQREYVLENTKINTGRFVEIIKLNNENLIANVEELLVVLSHLPSVKDFNEEDCNDFFGQLLNSYPKYTNFGVILPDGYAYCSSLPLEEPVFVRDRLYYQSARDNLGFSVGEYQVGRITKKPGINFGYPVFNAEGEVSSVVFAAVNLDWLNSLVETANLPDGVEFWLLDQEGKVLVNFPDSKIGEDFSEEEVLDMLRQSENDSLKIHENDSSNKLYAFTKLKEEPLSPSVIMAIDKGVIFAPADKSFRQSVVVLVILFSLGLVFALVFGSRLTSKQMEYLEQIEKARQKEKELNEILKLINKILRHDILNDLSVVSGNIDTYFKYGKEKMDVDEVLSDTEESVDRSIAFIHKMKELESAVSSGDSLRKIKLSEIVENARIENPEIEIELKEDAELEVDHAMFSVMDNLAKNAHVHGKAQKIEIKVRKEKENIVISVADDGSGIPDEVKAQLFQEGFKYGDTGNTGLGLFIIKRTIERYGGSVEVKDNSPKGAVFVMKLPALEKY